jgi:hypothetical protein
MQEEHGWRAACCTGKIIDDDRRRQGATPHACPRILPHRTSHLGKALAIECACDAAA